ncbi:hypothetical protein CHUAL_005532 [Chamberlinius hualienensis]
MENILFSFHTGSAYKRNSGNSYVPIALSAVSDVINERFPNRNCACSPKYISALFYSCLLPNLKKERKKTGHRRCLNDRAVIIIIAVLLIGLSMPCVTSS